MCALVAHTPDLSALVAHTPDPRALVEHTPDLSGLVEYTSDRNALVEHPRNKGEGLSGAESCPGQGEITIPGLIIRTVRTYRRQSLVDLVFRID